MYDDLTMAGNSVIGYKIFNAARTSLNDLWSGQKILFTESELERNSYFRFKKKLYTGEYAKDKQLLVKIDGNDQSIPYNVMKLNYFKLITNKVDSVVFQNDIVVKGSTQEQTDKLTVILEETNALSQIRKAMMNVEVYGNTIIRVNYGGINVIDPTRGTKIVSRHDMDEITGIVVYEPLPLNGKQNGAIRVEVSMPGSVYESVHLYSGNNTLGEQIRYKYRNRWIPKDGKSYSTGTSINTCQWLSINRLPSDIYGQSPYDEIQDIVFSIEKTTSANLHVVSQNATPPLIIGMQMVTTNEATGCYELKSISGRDGKYIISDEEKRDPKYLEGGAENLQQSRDFTSDLKQIVYEFSEISSSMMNGSVSSNLSSEALESAYKNTMDRANRELASVWYEIRNAVCCLANLHGMDVTIKDISIDFPIGRSMNEQEKAELAEKLAGFLSHSTILQKLYGYTEEQTQQEKDLIIKEQNKGEVQL